MVACLFLWIGVNTFVLRDRAFDPYPYIFLNLVLSMVAALQAPVIMMSQNRQSTTDRQMAAHDYEVNLKAEIEIMALHETMDSLRSEQLVLMLAKQQEQIDLLTLLLARRSSRSGPPGLLTAKAYASKVIRFSACCRTRSVLSYSLAESLSHCMSISKYP
jgi:uncharacterized membrane protein